MASVRERSKASRREAILKASEELFRKHGYDAASLEMIAAEAGVSVGTLYTYFGSKPGIVHALLEPVMAQMKADGRKVIMDPPDDPADAVIAIFDAYRFTGEWRKRDLFQAFDPRADRRDRHVIEANLDFEGFIRPQIAELVGRLQGAGRMNPALEAEDVALVLYTLLSNHFERFLLADGSVTYESVIANLHRRIRQLFLPWRA